LLLGLHNPTIKKPGIHSGNCLHPKWHQIRVPNKNKNIQAPEHPCAVGKVVISKVKSLSFCFGIHLLAIAAN
jgi:hypothetical protein